MESDRVDRLIADVVDLFPVIDHEAKTLGARLLHLSDLTQQHYSAVCERLGISLSGHSVLTTLRRHSPRELTLSEINRDALVTSGGMTFVVGRLESAGYLRRRAHPTDRRAVLLHLTPAGRRMAERVIVAMAEADKSIVDQVRQRDRVPVTRMLRKLQTAVEGTDDEGSNASPRHAPGSAKARSRAKSLAPATATTKRRRGDATPRGACGTLRTKDNSS